MMRRFVANAILTLLLGAFSVAALVGFGRVSAPTPRVLPIEGVQAPNYGQVHHGIVESELRTDLEAFNASGGRFTGSSGLEQAGHHIRRTLRDAGFQILEQPVKVVVPVTRYARLLDENGSPIAGIELYPLLPNAYRTVTTPPGGLTGKIHRGERGMARDFDGIDLEGQFVLLPEGRPWDTVAGMGVAAVFYFERHGVDVDPKWPHHHDKSLNVPRFLLRGPVDVLSERTVTVDAHVDFVERVVHNIMGVLEPKTDDGSLPSEAVVLTAHYDAHSYAPDLAPGANQSAGAVALLNVARHLARQRALKRSVAVLFTAGHCQGLHGMRQVVDALGVRGRRPDRLKRHVERLAEAERDLALVQGATEVAADDAYWAASGEAVEETWWSNRNPAVRAVFERRMTCVLDDRLMAATERLERAKMNWVRAGRPVSAGHAVGDAFTVYTECKQEQRRVIAAQSVPLGTLKFRYGSLVARQRLREGLTQEMRRRRDALAARKVRIAGSVDIARRLAPYDKLVVLGLDLTLGSGRLAMVCGEPDLAPHCRPADGEVAAQFGRAAEGLTAAVADISYQRTEDGRPRFVNLLSQRDIFDLPGFLATGRPGSLYLDSSALLHAGHTAFTLYTADDDRRRLGMPTDTFDQVLAGDHAARQRLSNLVIVVRLVAAATHQMALGAGRLLPTRLSGNIQDLPGQVVSQLGDGLVPSHRMSGALVRFASMGHAQSLEPPGVGGLLLLKTDREGRFNLPAIWGQAISGARPPELHMDVAVVRPEDGQITWKLNTPMSGWGMPFQVTGLNIRNLQGSPVTAVVFRATAIQMFPMPDPNTLGRFPGYGFVERSTLTPPAAFNVEQRPDSPGIVFYVPTDTTLYFTFKKGTRHRPNLQQVRAFALNVLGPADGSNIPSDAPEIIGRGYAALETPRLINVELDAARSMAQVNARRARSQAASGLADPMLLQFNDRTIELANRAGYLSERSRPVEARRAAMASLAYSSHVHPVTRRNTADAIRGIVFYLFLTIPFVIFVEKLLIGHPDIRHQIAWQAVFFVIVFTALRTLHPAYELVRSPLVILLGFITLALALMIGAFISAKFSSNVAEAYRRVQQRAEALDVSRVGAAATAFALGLNHLRKRPLRTGLTASTLVLITFVMISFTSVSSDVVDTRFSLGEAPYTGLLLRDPNLRDVTDSYHALREIYGHDQVVAPRAWGGRFAMQIGQTPQLAKIAMSRRIGGATAVATAHAVLGLGGLESKVLPILDTFDVCLRWIDDPAEAVCYLPQPLADALRLTDEDVRSGVANVKIEGRTYRVLGVFDQTRLDALTDLDGESLMPADIRLAQPPEAVGVRPASAQEMAVLPDDVPRIPARHVIITPIDAMPIRSRIASVAVALPGMDYATARDFIGAHLERSGQFTYFGLDGVAFYGGRLRAASMHGLVDVVLPILIVALTVFNTMYGSVYERRDELYVFNAVGLSPNHVRWLFFAEALVFAVVGAVGGYLLAQAVGAVLRALDLTAGLTMNYSSMSAIWVTVVIMLVVLASSAVPAMIASRLAAPALTMTRKRETAEGDEIELELPFLFSRRDRVAVIAWLADWFDQYGEGSVGTFFCDPPRCEVRDDGQGGAEPVIRATTWHKPYDLGVRQDVEVCVRKHRLTQDNIASVVLRRHSGDHHAWQRCCHGFIGHLRKRFLNWRGLGERDRLRLLEKGRVLLESVEMGQ